MSAAYILAAVALCVAYCLLLRGIFSWLDRR